MPKYRVTRQRYYVFEEELEVEAEDLDDALERAENGRYADTPDQEELNYSETMLIDARDEHGKTIWEA